MIHVKPVTCTIKQEGCEAGVCVCTRAGRRKQGQIQSPPAPLPQTLHILQQETSEQPSIFSVRPVVPRAWRAPDE